MITVLGGGIGASRFWQALLRHVDAAELTIVVNTADDLWMHGLRVCPDLDTTLYALSGRQAKERGWGLTGESFRCMDTLGGLGHDVWFNLGDRDLATHLLRTGLLCQGVGLCEVTRRLGDAMGVVPRVLPMTEDEVATHVHTIDGRISHYQEFLVRRAARDEVRELTYAGAADARPSPGVLEAIESADLVVLGPSNPLASIGPILAVPGVRDVLRRTRAHVVAVTPVVSGIPITDPGERRRADSRAALLRARGLAHTASAVASLYDDVCDTFVLDPADSDQLSPISGLGVDVLMAPTLVSDPTVGDEVIRQVIRHRRHQRPPVPAHATMPTVSGADQ